MIAKSSDFLEKRQGHGKEIECQKCPAPFAQKVLIVNCAKFEPFLPIRTWDQFSKMNKEHSLRNSQFSTQLCTENQCNCEQLWWHFWPTLRMNFVTQFSPVDSFKMSKKNATLAPHSCSCLKGVPSWSGTGTFAWYCLGACCAGGSSAPTCKSCVHVLLGDLNQAIIGSCMLMFCLRRNPFLLRRQPGRSKLSWRFVITALSLSLSLRSWTWCANGEWPRGHATQPTGTIVALDLNRGRPKPNTKVLKAYRQNRRKTKWLTTFLFPSPVTSRFSPPRREALGGSSPSPKECRWALTCHWALVFRLKQTDI